MQNLKSINSLFIRETIIGECELHGKYTGTLLKFKNGTSCVYPECPICNELKKHEQQKKIEAENKMKAEEEKNKEWMSKLKKAHIRKRYHGGSLESWNAQTEDQKTILKVCLKFVKNFSSNTDKGLLFQGSVGTGKSCLVSNICKALILRGFNVRYITHARLLSGLRSCYSQTSTMTEDDYYDLMCSYDLLVIDEIGIKTMSSDEFNTLFRVIDERYSDCKSTVLAMNLIDKDAEDVLTDRIIDRMNEIAIPVTFNWKSFRGR